MASVDDEDLIEKFSAQTADPAFDERVGVRRRLLGFPS
jgi:hypothetical protein